MAIYRLHKTESIASGPHRNILVTEVVLLQTMKLPATAARDPGGKVLPYMGYIGTCRGIGYGFWRLWILK